MSTKATPAKQPAAKVAPKPAAKAPAKAPAAAAKAATPEANGHAVAAKAEAVPKADNLAEAPAATGEAPAEKKTRQQLTNILHINISQARCATHLKQNLGDEQIEAEIKELRKQLKAAKEAKDAGLEKELKEKIADLSKALVRMSSETPIAAAVVMDNLVKELIRHGMDMTIACERKIVEVANLHDGTPASLLYYPIFEKLETFVDYNPDREEELRKERAATNKAAKDAREAKKAAAEKAGAKGKAGGKAAPKAAVEEDLDGEEEHSEHTKTTFFTYVENALKVVKKDEPYRTMRVSNRVREYLSDLVAEGLARLAMLARLVVQHVMGVRTMNADHIKAIVHILMADAGRTEEQIAEVKQQIDEKLGIYHGHLKTEKEKKASSLAVEKKAELERKKLEADLVRKKKQAELAKKRAQEASAKAESLTLETEKLEPIVAANKAAAEAAAAEVAAAEAAVPAVEPAVEETAAEETAESK